MDLPKQIQVIANPAAGKSAPVMKTLNRVFTDAGIKWDLAITHGPGDGRRLARAATEAGADVVAAYGGDGTVMEVADGLRGTETRMAILPGGTANVMAVELGIPTSLEVAARVLTDVSSEFRAVDMGQVNQTYSFILRASMGITGEMIAGAKREVKERLGLLAYAISALNALADPPVSLYRLRIDSEPVESEGVICFIANSGTLGIRNLKLKSQIDVSDGLLDVVILRRADLGTLLEVASEVITGNESSIDLLHWQARHIQVEMDPVQTVQVDGEILEAEKLDIHVLPEAVRIIVPGGG